MGKINFNNLYQIRHRSLIFVQFIVFRALGLSPWTFYHFVEFYRHKKINYLNLEYCLSYWGSYYNIVLSAFIIITNFLYLDLEHLYFKEKVILLASTDIQIYLQAASFTSTSIILWNYVSLQAIIINFLNRLQRVDIKLMKDSKKYKPKNATGFCLMFFVNLFVSISLIVMQSTTNIRYFVILSFLTKLLLHISNAKQMFLRFIIIKKKTQFTHFN